MHAPFPLTDPLLWLRWSAAAAMLLWLPGHLAVGRWLSGLEPLGRTLCSLAAGLLLVPLLGTALGLARLPLSPVVYLPAALLSGLALGRAPAHRRAVEAWSAGLAPLSGAAQLWLLGCAGGVGLMLWAGFHDLPVPPHLHDAANHAELVRRVIGAEALSPARLFPAGGDRPAALYLAGWHGAAALIARLGGLAPYVSAWFLPLCLLCLLPAALTLLWRAFGVAGGGLMLGALLTSLNKFAPAGVLGWGGFGLIAGMFLTPAVVLAWRGAARERTPWAGALVGLLLGGLLQIHAAEVVVVLLLAIWLPRHRAGGERGVATAAPGRRAWPALLCGAGALALAAWPEALPLLSVYAGKAVAEGHAPLSLGQAVGEYIGAGGRAGALKPLLLAGVALGLALPALRRLSLLGLALGAYYLVVATRPAPDAGALAAPFYGQAARVLYLQVFVLGPLLAAPPLVAAAWVRARRGPAWGAAALVLLCAAALHPAPRAVVKMYRSFHAVVPFDKAAYELACRLPAAVSPGDVVANFRDDGSAWAAQISGCAFLQPCSWELWDAQGRSLHRLACGLAASPWGVEAEALRRRGVNLLWASDLSLPAPHRAPLDRAAFAGDPRFVPLLQGTSATLYRIRWQAGAEGQTPGRERPAVP